MTIYPRSGHVVRITRSASVQFTRPFNFRIIGVNLRTSCEGWIYLDGYQLDAQGNAVERRTLFVMAAGLQVPAPAGVARVS